MLFQEGQPADCWWVLRDGSIDLVRHVGRDETLLGVMDVPGRWAGGFRAWDEHGVYLATGRGAAAGCILRVPAEALRRVWTARFPLGLQLIEGVSRSARNYETMARQREALAALGTLAAGLAHELNNPAAAATRAVDALGSACEEMLVSLRRLAAAPITADQFARIDALRQELAPKPLLGSPWSSPTVRTRCRTGCPAAAWRGSGSWRPSSPVQGRTSAGASGSPGCSATAALEPALDWVASTLSATGLLDEVKESTRRISELVAAVKSYSQLDRASMQQTEIAEGVESTLVMLAHRIPDGVTDRPGVRPRRPPYRGPGRRTQPGLDQPHRQCPRRHGRPGHAPGVDAHRRGRGGRGDRRHRPGMSPEALEHAFDPFFTTKGVGEGTGLGLDISRRIVDRHGGEITIDTRPGGTVLRVRLPAVG